MSLHAWNPMGVPGRIHVSEEYQRLTEETFLFEERGATELKGVGWRGRSS
jgi:hypothetical protein